VIKRRKVPSQTLIKQLSICLLIDLDLEEEDEWPKGIVHILKSKLSKEILEVDFYSMTAY